MGNQRDSDYDRLANLEDEFAASQQEEGYQNGLAVGRSAGLEEGLRLGSEEGSKRGCELGYIHGYTMTCKQFLVKAQTSESKLLRKVNDLLELVDNFPRTNAESNSEEKLTTIRSRFKQILSAEQIFLHNLGRQEGAS